VSAGGEHVQVLAVVALREAEGGHAFDRRRAQERQLSVGRDRERGAATLTGRMPPDGAVFSSSGPLWRTAKAATPFEPGLTASTVLPWSVIVTAP
jgi:hypothetical protein